MFQGSMTALVTPMQGEESRIDFLSLTHLVDWQIQQGTHALVINGTTGESATLNLREQHELIEYVIKIVNHRIPVIAGTYANSTYETIERTRVAMELGADACLIMTPAYIKPTQEGLYLHYKAIAEAVPIPQILYNVPSRTACDLLPATVARLATLSNIIGIKEATGSMQRAQEIRELVKHKLDIYSGDDATARELILAGAQGVISVTANIAPKAMHDMVEAALVGNKELALDLDRPLQALHQQLFLETNPIPVKWALQQMGYIKPGIRMPLTSLSEGYQPLVSLALHQANINY